MYDDGTIPRVQPVMIATTSGMIGPFRNWEAAHQAWAADCNRTNVGPHLKWPPEEFSLRKA